MMIALLIQLFMALVGIWLVITVAVVVVVIPLVLISLARDEARLRATKSLPQIINRPQ